MHPNPYAEDLGTRDPFEALGAAPSAIQSVVKHWNDEQFERSYAPGKWSARRILIHLAQAELALTTRARYALSEPGYAAQAFDQDVWMGLDEGSDARTALEAYLALRRMNLQMWRRLTADQRRRTFTHPEYGELTVEWIAAQMAGHDLHHLEQFERIAAA